MVVFILQANGALVEFNGSHTIFCRRAFRSKESAEAYKPEFRKACITPRNERDLFCLADDSNLRINVGEIELED